MSLSQALGTAVSGMRVTQSGMALVAANVANAETPGYVKKTLTQSATAANGAGLGVRLDTINRELDAFVQRQLRTETSGGAYADMRAQFYRRLQQVYGEPGSSAALETIFNDFSEAVQSLITSPESISARTGVITAGQVLAQQLNGMTNDIQGLRTDAELGLSAAVKQANNAMQRIAQINNQLAAAQPGQATTASLLDQRDLALSQLSELMDIRVIEGDHNQITVFTGSGNQLVGKEAGVLAFDPQGTVTASAAWNADSSQSTLGTISLSTVNGGTIDLIAIEAIKSGRIAALIEMRDHLLPQAQAQIDEVAATMAQSLSDRTDAGVAASAGAQNGFDIDTAGLLDGNKLTLTFTELPGGAQRTVTIFRVDDPAALPLPNDTTAAPNDQVIGVDFSGGPASVAAQLNAALGTTGLQFSNSSGTVLRVLDDGLGNRVNVDALSSTTTVTSLIGGSAEFALFTDGGVPFTDAISANNPQRLGFAGRIAVNYALVADPSRLVVYQTSPMTLAGDGTRPTFIFDRLTKAVVDFSPRTGVGTTASPFTGTLPQYMRQVVSQQGDAAITADSLAEGQAIVVNTLQQHFSDQSSVNIDEEMAMLLKLQTAYGANARVMTTVREMLDLLLRS